MSRALTFWLLIVLAMASCQGDDQLPPLARGLPSDLNVAEAEFDARVKQRYRVGTSEDALLTDLGRQGFSVEPARDGMRAAQLHRPNGCGRTVWSVRWQTDAAHKLTSTWGVYGFQCL